MSSYSRIKHASRVSALPGSENSAVGYVWDEYLSRPRRTTNTIPDILSTNAPANRLDILRRLASVLLSLMTLLFCTKSTKSQNQLSITPSGVYIYSGNSYKKNGDTYVYFGTIKVLQLDSNRILVNFYICKGAPSYNSGSFIDSLPYSHNKALYRGDTTIVQTTCKLTFTFTTKGVDLSVITDYINQACGFGHGVVPHGYFKKVKRKIPTMTEMLEHPLTGEQVRH